MDITKAEAHWITILAAYAPQGHTFEIQEGRKGQKYRRVVHLIDGEQRSVHAFLGTAGEVYKAAGWAAPAKGVRFDLADETSREALFTAAQARSAFAGGYLYR